MRVALKEWAVVVDALGRGDQILLLRKGGLLEGRAGFQLDHPAFLLFPTWYHQQRDAVSTAAQTRHDVLAKTASTTHVVLEYLAAVVECRRLSTMNEVEALADLQICQTAALQQRFDWGARPGIYALAMRVFRLPAPATLPLVPAYAGCKSWIELETNLDLVGAQPVLAGPDFQTKLNAFREAVAEWSAGS